MFLLKLLTLRLAQLSGWYRKHQGIIRLIFQERKITAIKPSLSSHCLLQHCSVSPPDWWKPTSHFLHDCSDVLGEMPAFSWLICLLSSNQCHSGREMPCVLNAQLSHTGRFYELGLPWTCTNALSCWWDSLGVKNNNDSGTIALCKKQFRKKIFVH